MTQLLPYLTRPAAPTDAAAITVIYNQGIAERTATFETRLRTESEISEMISRGERLPVLVSAMGNQVVGWATIWPYGTRDCYAGVGEFSVYVARSHRNTGVGRHLVGELLAEAEKRNYWKLVSRVFPQNVASRQMLRHAGFREVGTYVRHGRLDGDWRDCVIVEKLLGEALAP